MAGITDTAYQKVLDELNCPLIFTEMISASSLLHKSAILGRYFTTGLSRPTAVQIFGHEPAVMAEVGCLLVSKGAQIIDINMGCPAKKIVKSGNGIALMRDPHLAAKIMETMRNAVSVPLGLKIRMGWDPENPSGIEYARIAEKSGFNYVTIHARYRSSYEPPAQWDFIKRLKDTISLPVIGNGDVFTGSNAKRMLDETGCDAVMLGRGIMGNPWLPGQCEDFLVNNISPVPVPLSERFRVVKLHCREMHALYGRKIAALAFRKHAAWYLKGLPNIATFRKELFSYTDPDQFVSFVDRYKEIHEKENSFLH